MDAIDAGVTDRKSGDSGAMLPASAVWKRYGVCDRTLDRWIASETLGFPKPLVINKRRYFRELELIDWERNRAAVRSVEAAA